MNSYISIFNPISPKKWVLKSLFGLFFVITAIFSFNYIIDPYNITSYNLLDIKYKFARDDRTEKLSYFKTLPPFDTIMIGSSRVYSINPRSVSKYLGGNTYNFGVGTATVEDHLGILLYLQKHNKLPKNLIMGVDFYTFNPDVPPNKYFLSNKELNFLSFSQHNTTSDWPKFFSLDATRASMKTLKNHLKNKNEKPRFNQLGWGSNYLVSTNKDLEKEKVEIDNEIYSNRILMYSDFNYKHIDPKRVAYYEEIKKICKDNDIKLYLFTTPLNPILLKKLHSYPTTNNALKEFTTYLSTFTHFTNFYVDRNFTSNPYNFNGATHTTANAGDLIVHTILENTHHDKH